MNDQEQFRNALDAAMNAHRPLITASDMLAIAAQFTGALIDAQGAETPDDYQRISNVLATNLKLGNSAAILKRVTPEGTA